ncbi:MAG: hypothetical protein FD165_139 [Gammaproteobacteria bacterium]|nr:MAG: hypothetical protein FD165_139 [Gammaproteobacteria bacterium]TND06717.1 MAG: hypothetical protein FD120_449 [Gammaproteobacteria bacterium]
MTTVPDNTQAATIDRWIDAALQHHQAGRLPDAEALYRQALVEQPDHPDALHLLGFVAYQCGRHQQALELISTALRRSPDAPDFHNHLGLVLAALGRPADAIASYGNALRLAPEFPEAHNNLGIRLREDGRLTEAEAHYRAAVAARPVFSDAWNNLGNVCRERGEFDAALAAYREALRQRPDFAEAHSNILFTLSHYLLADPDQLLQEHQGWDRVHGVAGRAHAHAHPRRGDPEKRLRIGYVSPDFRLHAANSFFESLIAAHTRDAVEIFCYAEVSRPDAVTERIRVNADVWRSTVGLSDDALGRQIRDDGIDILVDLAGHTTGNRLRVFTGKPAPIQVSYLGYCATTGLTAMDYWITDGVIHPPDTIERTVEAIIRLPRCWVTYRPPVDAPPVRLPARSGITFGCFNERSKITPATIALWSSILLELPDARLVLKARQYADDSVRQAIIDTFTQHGVAANRLVFLPATGYLDYLAAYQDVDIALDPVPRAGGVTTADALWMGVPVITLCGQRFIERHGASLLRAAGMDEWIAVTPRDYVDKALALARDHVHRRTMRLAQRDRMAASPLCDALAHARAMEQIYRDMWRAYVRNTPLTS